MEKTTWSSDDDVFTCVKGHNRQGMRPHFLTFCTKATFKGRGAVAFQKGQQLYNKAEQKGNCTTIQLLCSAPSLANYIIERLRLMIGIASSQWLIKAPYHATYHVKPQIANLKAAFCVHWK